MLETSSAFCVLEQSCEGDVLPSKQRSGVKLPSSVRRLCFEIVLMIEKHKRKTIRLKGFDYSQPGEYFVTICAQNHEHRFGAIVDGKMNLNEEGNIINRCWKGIPEHFSNVVLDEYEKKVPHDAGQHSKASGCRTIFMEY